MHIITYESYAYVSYYNIDYICMICPKRVDISPIKQSFSDIGNAF